MKAYHLFIIASLLFLSCKQKSEISKDFNCETKSFQNLETVTDVQNIFSVDIPKSWKTNLYFDDKQSSIYTADTTKQLTKTLLLDITAIKQNIKFDDTFKLQQEQDNLSKSLIKIKSEETTLLNKPSYYTISKGKKGKFTYQICHIFIKINEQNFILAKAEMYGDSLVNTRLCNAFGYIEKIKLLN
ncbi:hypothetical protein [uncultured Polaribacter sp.]|uniref:hypothetical protein n=1 Tax=uncultured Polaribacter sp. TaxID=174711 RepID=UPI0026282ED5|nr:hypothetical protein [uncultured Polaribacter sp.]